MLCPLGEVSAAGMLPSSLQGRIHKVNRRQAREGALGHGIRAKRAQHRPSSMEDLILVQLIVYCLFNAAAYF